MKTILYIVICVLFALVLSAATVGLIIIGGMQ